MRRKCSGWKPAVLMRLGADPLVGAVVVVVDLEAEVLQRQDRRRIPGVAVAPQDLHLPADDQGAGLDVDGDRVEQPRRGQHGTLFGVQGGGHDESGSDRRRIGGGDQAEIQVSPAEDGEAQPRGAGLAPAAGGAEGRDAQHEERRQVDHAGPEARGRPQGAHRDPHQRNEGQQAQDRDPLPAHGGFSGFAVDGLPRGYSPGRLALGERKSARNPPRGAGVYTYPQQPEPRGPLRHL